MISLETSRGKLLVEQGSPYCKYVYNISLHFIKMLFQHGITRICLRQWLSFCKSVHIHETFTDKITMHYAKQNKNAIITVNKSSHPP